MIGALFRLFKRKRKPSKRKYFDSNFVPRKHTPFRQLDCQNERIVVRTTVEVHNNEETDIQYHTDDNYSIEAANIQLTSQARDRECKENILPQTKVLSRDTVTKLGRDVIDEVAEFYQRRLYPQTDVRILISKNVIVYVLGTNHANTQCREDVVDIIEKIQPQKVLVELCSLRACGCDKHVNNAFQTAPTFTFRYLRSIINQLGFLPAMIFFSDVFREHLVSESSLLHYGGEFIAAMTTAKNVKDCRLVLADRPIEITVKRQASAMGNWRGLRVTALVTLAVIFKRHMKRLMMSANRLIFDDPKTYEVLVFERDLYLTYSIQEAAKQLENDSDVSRVVAVIGQGHVPGIQTYWGKVPSEFIPLIMSPDTILDQ